MSIPSEVEYCSLRFYSISPYCIRIPLLVELEKEVRLWILICIILIQLEVGFG